MRSDPLTSIFAVLPLRRGRLFALKHASRKPTVVGHDDTGALAAAGVSRDSHAATKTPETDAGEAPRARSLRAADRDAVCSAVMNGLTDPFMIPYALALGASAFQAGLLSSVRNLLLAFVQLFSAEAVRRLGSRKSVVLWTAGIQAGLWIPLTFLQPLFGQWAVAALIVAYTIGTASAALGGPSWGSLLADHVPPQERGSYFGRRARLVAVATTAAGLAAGGVLHLTKGHAVLGFGLLCLGAAAARLMSWRALSEFHDSGWKAEKEHIDESFVAFVRSTPHNNFARFSWAMAANSFGTHVAAPFFAVYMLETLKFSYAEYTAVILSGAVTGMLCSAWWGRLGDRWGNRSIMSWTLAGVAALPVLWMVFDSPPWMLALNVAGAFLWGGLNLSASNFVYDVASPARRHTFLAYFNVLNGLGVSAGAFVGAWAVSAFAGMEQRPFLVVFVMSAVLRLLSWILFETMVREVRAVRSFGLREVMLDILGQSVVAVLGFFSVRPEEENKKRPERRKSVLPWGGPERRSGRERRAHP